MPPVILTIIGWLAVALGTLGVFLPLLPTTPFILLAAWCFARSSPRFHQWLLYRSWFGGYLRHWQQYRAMPRGAKPRAIAMIVVTFAISLWLVKLTWVRIMLLVILACLLFFRYSSCCAVAVISVCLIETVLPTGVQKGPKKHLFNL